jgi:hypothetical protein
MGSPSKFQTRHQSIETCERPFEPSNEEWEAKVEDYGFCYGRPYVTVDDGRHTVCAVFTDDEHSKPVNHFAEKARLIAAAPCMFEALDSLLNCVDGVHDYDQLHRCKRKALAALLKARGETSLAQAEAPNV